MTDKRATRDAGPVQIELLMYPAGDPAKATGRATITIDDDQLAGVVFDALQSHLQLCYRMIQTPAGRPEKDRPWATPRKD